jgi:hypothetical protein
MCVTHILGPFFFFLPCLSCLTHPVPCSGSKQRESLSRIRGRGLRSNGRLPHERRTTRRRRAQSRAIRPAPPNALALSPTTSPLPPAKRPRPRPSAALSLPPTFAFALALAAVPASGEGLPRPRIQRLVPPPAAPAQAPAAGHIPSAHAHPFAFAVPDSAPGYAGSQEEVSQLRARRARSQGSLKIVQLFCALKPL